MGRTVYYDYKGNLIDPPKADPIKPTNGDRIRAMSDEELASELLSLFAAFYEVEWSREAILDWLKQEVDT